MAKFTAGVHVLFLVVVGHLSQQVIGHFQCSTTGKNGIDTCVCNIMNACDEHGKARANWTDYLPENVEQFGHVEGGGRNLAYLCEGGAVAILYDCNSRIPLYAATKITGAQLSKKPLGRPSNSFRRSENQLSTEFQQEDADYRNTKNLCLETYENCFKDDERRRPSGNSNTQRDRKRVRSETPCLTQSALTKTTNTRINRGHLIASQYGRAVLERTIATFTYTNVVPQFERFNNGAWRASENKLIGWGQVFCAVKGAQHVEMFIIVGAVPSTNFEQPCYFGKQGFSVKKDSVYRVNVPRYMWTAACCKYYLNGTWKYHSTAFYGQNDPGNKPCSPRSVAKLFINWARQRNKINLFPQTPQCEDENNYIRLR